MQFSCHDGAESAEGHDHTEPGNLDFLGIAEFFRVDSLDKLKLCNQYCTVNLCLLCIFKI